MIGRIAVFDKVSEDAPSYRPTFKEQIGAELAEIAVFKTTASFELGDTLELQQDVYRHNGSPQHKRDFPAVSGTWSGYDIDKYNGKKVSEAFVYASESFNFKNLNEPWPQVENENPDMYPDMVADRFRIGTPSEPIFGTGEDFFTWDNEPLAFSVVSGQWYGYMMDRFNCKEAKRHLSDVTNLSENLLFVSDSFDMTELEKPWARINKGQNLDIDSDLYAEEFSVETLDSSFTHAGLNNGEANIHPHFNENGQLDAILFDFEQKYEYHAGFYQYDVISVSDKEHSVGGLYELTLDILNAHMAKTDAENFIVRDNTTGYFETLSKDTSLDTFIQEFKEQSKEYTHGNTHVYLIPVESKKSKRVNDTQVNQCSHDIVIMNDLDDPRLWGHLYDDGAIVVNWIHEEYTNIYHKLDDSIYVGEQTNGLSARENAHIADLIAQKIGQPEKEFIHPFNYAMVYQNEKGDLRTNWVQSKKIRTNEQAIVHAEKIIEKWRKGDDKSNIKMLSITKEYGDGGNVIFKIENGKAIRPEPEVILDNTTLSLDDLSDLQETEQSK